MIKKIIKSILRSTYNKNFKILMRNCILFESNPDFSDNTKAVYDELIARNYNKKYKLIWVVKDKRKFKDVKVKNVKFIERDGNLFKRIKFIYYNVFSKYIIDCNYYIYKYNKNQFRMHIPHGAWLKVTSEYVKKAKEFDYIVMPSHFFDEITCKEYNITKEKVTITGFPRCDYLFKDNKKMFDIYPEIDRKKIVLWLPTYRNHKGQKDKEGNSAYYMNISFPYGVPSINSKQELIELNKILKTNGILLLIKLHPVEDDSKLQKLNLSNIKLLKDTIFDKNHTNLYQLLSMTDALITDYSSVYYDYLLTDKPIGLAIADIEEYRKHMKLLFDNFEENIVGEYIYSFDDLKKFINNLGKNFDNTYEKRIEKKKLYNKHLDGKSSQRVIDILESRIKETEKRR